MDTTPARSKWWPYLLIVAAVFLVWGQTITFQFVWDDKNFIQDLKSIRSLSNVPQMFYALDAQSSYPKGFVLFRPLRTLHYAILFALGGGGSPKPWLFHLANVVWHAASCVLLYRMLRLLIAGVERREADPAVSWMALLGALAFAVHPVVSEVVCWAKSLDDLMATTFVLASCCALLSWRPDQNHRAYWWAVGLFAMAVYSKESAVPLALFCVPLLAFKRQPLAKIVRHALPFLAVAGIFVIHRHLVIGRTSQMAPISGSYFQTLLDTLTAGPIYARLLAGIPPFCIDYIYMSNGNALTSTPVLIGGGLVLMLVGLSLLALWRPTVLIGNGFLWMILFFLPVSNIIPTMQYCAERFMYLPLIGWIVALVGAMLLVRHWRLVAASFAIVLVVWSMEAWNRSWIWKDELTLFVQSHLEGPSSLRVQDNAVAATFGLPHMRAAFKLVYVPGARLRSVAVEDGTPDWPAVEKTLLQLRKLFPDHNVVISSLAISLAQQGKIEEALPYFELVAQREPNNPFSWMNLGRGRETAGLLPEAEKAYQRAVELDAKSVMALEQLAHIQWEQKEYAAAKKTYETLNDIGPDKTRYQERIAAADEKLSGALPRGNGNQ
jgi:hypothetical protein